MGSSNWAIGDSVVVKPGVTDPITGSALGGWQGRLIALEDQGDRLAVQWDSLTLKSIPPALILGHEEWGVSWSAIRLVARDVLPTAARDREEDVSATIAALETRYSWLSLGEQGRRIQQIVNRAETRDEFAALRTWHAYLEEHLAVPFVASVVEPERGPVRQGTQVIVTGSACWMRPGARSSGSDTSGRSTTSRCVTCGPCKRRTRSSSSSRIMRCGLLAAPLSPPDFFLEQPGRACASLFLPRRAFRRYAGSR